MNDLSHLTDQTKKQLNLDDELRIASLNDDRWIGYPKAIKIINMLTDLVNQSRQIRPECLLIIGDSNIGKTTVIHQFCQKFYSIPIYDVNMGVTDVQRLVLTIQAPVKANVKELYINILEHFFVPFRPTDPESKLRHQALHLMRKFSTKMVIIDEIHNILSGTARQQLEVMNTLKYLSNELQLNIVGVGTKEAALVLHTDAQLASRFGVIDLPKWNLDEDFLRLLLSYKKLLPLKYDSDLASKEIAILLFEISGGNFGNLNKLLIECSKEAIRNGTEKITIEIIQKYKWLKPTEGVRGLRKMNLSSM